MLSIGFDPSFVDTLVRLEKNDGTLIEKLPQPGFHHRLTKISKVAGGNGVNVAVALKQLGHTLKLVVPIDKSFEDLLLKRGFKKSELISIHDKINETIVLHWNQGEIQLNQVETTLQKENWTNLIHDLWNNSPINLFLNWGLNSNSLEWVSIQWLTICGYSYNEIIETKNCFEEAIENQNPKKLCIIEPGKISDHRSKNQLLKVLQTINDSNFKENEQPILSFNEEEKLDFEKIKFPIKLYHTKSKVEFNNHDQKIVFESQNITNPKITVGAGDTFLAGIVDQLIKKHKINIEFAINITSKYLQGKEIST